MAAPDQAVPYAHIGPWTEQDWLELPDRRVELVDGTLVMSPNPAIRHQRLNLRIAARLDAEAPDGWEILPEPNARLATDRVLVPDIAILARADVDTVVNDAADVVLVVEIVSLGNAADDRTLEPRSYAEAGIRWYLRIEPRGLTGHLHELRDGAYVEVAQGGVLELAEPFPACLDLPQLLR